MLNKRFAKVKTPYFSFVNRTSVQIRHDVYAISFSHTQVTKI